MFSHKLNHERMRWVIKEQPVFHLSLVSIIAYNFFFFFFKPDSPSFFFFQLFYCTERFYGSIVY